MKKPEPTPVIVGPFGRPELGEPKPRKKFGNGDPGANPNSSAPPEPPDTMAACSIFTRTEITAGFTLATMSAKPTGRASFGPGWPTGGGAVSTACAWGAHAPRP